jgi:ABC-type branched-subunit amino acid transport system substrate-binding protein
MLRNPLSAVHFILTAATILMISGCAGTAGGPWSAPNQDNTGAIPSATDTPPPVEISDAPIIAKVALLLPMSGKGSDAGQAMLNASQLAMFDLNATSLFELLPEDTAKGAQKSMTAVMDNGANLVLGPLFSEDTKAIAATALQHNVNVISFSTDTTAATGNTFLIGFVPKTQVEQILAYTSSMGMKRVGLIAPRDIYGDSVAAAYFGFAQRYAMDNGGIVRYNTGSIPSAADIAILPKNLDAVLIASPAIEASKISNLLTAEGFIKTKRLGTGLWDTTEAPKLSGLQGAWYAASSPRLRTRFEHRYFETYGKQPPRIASLAYDATALAVVLAKSGRGFGRDSLTNPNGFAGIDGIFRFSADGLAERGLAILEINNGAASVIQDAPPRFGTR